MDIQLFEQYLATRTKISATTQQAYLQDLHEFFLLMGQKHRSLTQVQASDIQNYMQLLFNQVISHAYGIRKLAALKLLCKCIEERTNRPLLAEIAQHKIARFPVFCTESHLERVLANYTQIKNYTDARNKLVLILLYRYQLTINQLTHARTETTLQNKRSAHIRFSDGTAPIELNSHDHDLLVTYCRWGEVTSGYLFPVKQGAVLTAISSQAVWSLVKKLCGPARQTDQLPEAPAAPEFAENLELLKQRIIYTQKHPRP